MSKDGVLAESFGPNDGSAFRAKQAALLALGVVALALTAKIQVPLWPSPVPITMTTFAVLTIGAAFGPRLGLATVLAYLAVGALGYDVFATSSAENHGLGYMLGGSGGYLVGYALAALALGWAARRGMDRSVAGMALALVVGNVLIYVPGLVWLSRFTTGWEQTLAWGVMPFLWGDALKLALAALLLPGLWRIAGSIRG
jgi:biotin transport system substrate-specific component